jgi:hypothetical protein
VGIKRPDREADHSPHVGPRLRMSGAIPPNAVIACTGTNLPFTFSRVAEICQKYRSHLKGPGTRIVIRSKFRNDDPQRLGATVQNLAAGRPGARALCTPALSIVIFF